MGPDPFHLIDTLRRRDGRIEALEAAIVSIQAQLDGWITQSDSQQQASVEFVQRICKEVLNA